MVIVIALEVCTPRLAPKAGGYVATSDLDRAAVRVLGAILCAGFAFRSATVGAFRYSLQFISVVLLYT